MSGIAMASGTHNVLYVVTQHDSVYAFDADHNQQLWRVSMVDAAHGAPSGAIAAPSEDVGSYDINPEYGITSTPVIDPTTSTIYVVATSEESGAMVWRLHALDLATGQEKTNSPVVIQGSVAGTGTGSVNGRIAFQAKYQLNRPGLLLLNGQVIVAFGSHSDNGPYHGWLIAYDAATLLQTGISNTSPNADRKQRDVFRVSRTESGDQRERHEQWDFVGYPGRRIRHTLTCSAARLRRHQRWQAAVCKQPEYGARLRRSCCKVQRSDGGERKGLSRYAGRGGCVWTAVRWSANRAAADVHANTRHLFGYSEFDDCRGLERCHDLLHDGRNTSDHSFESV